MKQKNIYSIKRPRYVVLIKNRKYILVGGTHKELHFDSLRNLRTGKTSPMIKTYMTPRIAWRAINKTGWIMKFNPEIYEVIETITFRRLCTEEEDIVNNHIKIIKDEEDWRDKL